MAKYILKRLGYIIIVFFLLSILLFGIFKMVPGDPARLMVEGQKQSVSPEQYEMQEYVSDLINRFRFSI